MRVLAMSLLAAVVFTLGGGVAVAKKPVPIDPKNPCYPLPTELVCFEGHCFRRIVPCNPNI